MTPEAFPCAWKSVLSLIGEIGVLSLQGWRLVSAVSMAWLLLQAVSGQVCMSKGSTCLLPLIHPCRSLEWGKEGVKQWTEQGGDGAEWRTNQTWGRGGVGLNHLLALWWSGGVTGARAEAQPLQPRTCPLTWAAASAKICSVLSTHPCILNTPKWSIEYQRACRGGTRSGKPASGTVSINLARAEPQLVPPLGLAAVAPAKSQTPSQAWSAFPGKHGLVPVISLVQVWIDQWWLLGPIQGQGNIALPRGGLSIPKLPCGIQQKLLMHHHAGSFSL